MYKLQMITETQKIELKCKSRSVLLHASDLNFCLLRPCPPETLRFDGLFNGTRRAVHDDGASRAAKRAAEPADGVRAAMLQQLRKFSGLAALVRAGVDISTRFLRRLPFDRVIDVAPRVNVSQHISIKLSWWRQSCATSFFKRSETCSRPAGPSLPPSRRAKLLQFLSFRIDRNAS